MESSGSTEHGIEGGGDSRAVLEEWSLSCWKLLPSSAHKGDSKRSGKIAVQINFASVLKLFAS